ncbi:MAG: hypothetical protein ACYS99_08535 [Planctomycetota bacterium]|jgi:hypothetical protein
MRFVLPLAALGLVAAGCVSTPLPDPVTMEEIVQLSKGGAESTALVQALSSRPLGFPLTYESLKKLEAEGVPGSVIDAVLALSVERRARTLAPRYSYLDPWYPPYPYWHVRFGYHHHHR